MKGITSVLSRVLLAILPVALSAGWIRTFGGSEHDYGSSVQQTADGGYIVSGGSGSFGGLWLVRLTEYGDTLWTRTYEGSGAFVRQTADSGFMVAGDRRLPSGDKDFLVLKTDKHGELVWERTYNGGNQDRATCAQIDVNGGYIVAGYRDFIGDNGPRMWLLRIDSIGDTLWTRDYLAETYSAANSVCQTSDSGYLLTGYSGYQEDGGTNQSLWLVKTDSRGDTVWTRIYDGGILDRGEWVIESLQTGYVAVGVSELAENNKDVWMLRLDENGDTLWSRVWGGPDVDLAYYVEETIDAGYIITGSTQSFGSGAEDVWLIKTDSAGATLWTQTYGGADWDKGYSCYQAGDRGYVVTGITSSFGSGNYDLWVFKTDPSGNLPVELSPTRIYEPQPGIVASTLIPSAMFTNLGTSALHSDFFVECIILDDHGRSYYYDRKIVTQTFEPWESIHVEFKQWLAQGTGRYTATFRARSVALDSLPSRPVSVEFSYQPGPGIEDNYGYSCEVIQGFGNEIVVRYQDCPEGFHAAIYDAAGRLVDELHSSQTQGTVSWGESHGPGVYFIKSSEGRGEVYKVVLVRR